MTKRNFRFFIIAQWLLVILVPVVSITTERLLPPDLRFHIEAIKNAPATTQDWIVTVVGTVFVLFCVALSVGLFRFRKWAKKLLWPSFVIGIVLGPLYGPNVQTEWTATLSYIGSVADGIMLALVYYSPVGEMFETNVV